MTGVHFETGTISQTPYVMVGDVDKSALPRGYKVNKYLIKKHSITIYINLSLMSIVKPKSEVPKSKVLKSRPKGLGLTLKSHGPPIHPPITFKHERVLW